MHAVEGFEETESIAGSTQSQTSLSQTYAQMSPTLRCVRDEHLADLSFFLEYSNIV